MNKRISRFFSLLIAVIIIFQVTLTLPLRSRADYNSVVDFVYRCYSLTLDREPDDEGMDYWCYRLVNDEITGSYLAYQFIFSDEFTNKNVTDEYYVQTLYELFMGRRADDEGLVFWTDMLKTQPREAVFAGFANSEEFFKLCSDSRIPAGYFSLDYDLEQLNNVNLFVSRFYHSVLFREGDLGGQSYWVSGLLNGQFTGASCASVFLLGEEMRTMNLVDDAYVSILYWTFMGREPDTDGMNYWLSELSGGKSREYIFTGFVCSPEFETICNSYGIIKGDYVCTNPNGTPSDNIPASDVPTPDVQPDRDLVARFEALDGVEFVDCYHEDKDILRFTVEQPVDWQNPNGEKFKQYFTIQYTGENNINVFYVNGYYLEEFTTELTTLYNANQISVEHRFFRQSVPEGFKDTSKRDGYWQYLTMENAAADFHHIIDLMKQVFTNKWIFTGGSKGGCITNCQSMLYPKDADVYVAYVAPLFSGTSTPGLGDYLYTKVGDERYGKKKAAEYRQLVLDYQIALLELRDKLNDYYDYYDENDINTFNGLTADQFYDIFVFDQAIGIWQYGTDFDRLKSIMDKYKKKEPGYLYEISKYYRETSSGFDIEAYEGVDYEDYDPFIPYYINCAKELGCYNLEFDHIRDEIKKQNSSAELTISKEDENALYLKVSLDQETLNDMEFDDSFYKKQVNWVHTTDCTVIELYGSSDTLSCFKYPEADDNPNFHVFTAKNKCHQADFRDSEIWPEVQEILDKALAS